MANIKSSKKRNITNEKRRQRNVAVKSRMKTLVKQAADAIASKDAAKVKESLPRPCRKSIEPRRKASSTETARPVRNQPFNAWPDQCNKRTGIQKPRALFAFAVFLFSRTHARPLKENPFNPATQHLAVLLA